MKILIISMIALFSFTLVASTKVLMVTTHGSITVELNEDESPITSANFIQYVDDKFYDGLIFHRVIENFVIQGGGHTSDMTKVPTREPIINEANNSLSNVRGTIAMARTNDPHSATAQFYINVKDNTFLDYRSQEKWGYCVFGKIVRGIEVVDNIRKVATQDHGEYQDVPVEPIIILSAIVL